MSDSSGRASSQYWGDKDPVRDSWALLVMPPRAHRFSSRGPPCVHFAEATLSPAMKLRAVRQQQFDKERKMQNLARRFSWLIIGLVVKLLLPHCSQLHCWRERCFSKVNTRRSAGREAMSARRHHQESPRIPDGILVAPVLTRSSPRRVRH